MIITALVYAFKFLVLLLKIVMGVGLVICGLIAICAVPIAIIKVFPVVGIVLAVIIAAIVIFLVTHCINLSAKERKRKKLYETAKKNREKRLKEISEEQQ